MHPFSPAPVAPDIASEVASTSVNWTAIGGAVTGVVTIALFAIGIYWLLTSMSKKTSLSRFGNSSVIALGGLGFITLGFVGGAVTIGIFMGGIDTFIVR